MNRECAYQKGFAQRGADRGDGYGPLEEGEHGAQTP